MQPWHTSVSPTLPFSQLLKLCKLFSMLNNSHGEQRRFVTVCYLHRVWLQSRNTDGSSVFFITIIMIISTNWLTLPHLFLRSLFWHCSWCQVRFKIIDLWGCQIGICHLKLFFSTETCFVFHARPCDHRVPHMFTLSIQSVYFESLSVLIWPWP